MTKASALHIHCIWQYHSPSASLWVRTVVPNSAGLGHPSLQFSGAAIAWHLKDLCQLVQHGLQRLQLIARQCLHATGSSSLGLAEIFWR
jgi:hypothetical protein